jgi:hypothetical protein
MKVPGQIKICLWNANFPLFENGKGGGALFPGRLTPGCLKGLPCREPAFGLPNYQFTFQYDVLVRRLMTGGFFLNEAEQQFGGAYALVVGKLLY